MPSAMSRTGPRSPAACRKAAGTSLVADIARNCITSPGDGREMVDEVVDEAVARVAEMRPEVAFDERVVGPTGRTGRRGWPRRRRRCRAPACRSSRSGSRGTGPGSRSYSARSRDEQHDRPAQQRELEDRRRVVGDRGCRSPAAGRSRRLSGSTTRSKPSVGVAGGSRFGWVLRTSANSGGSAARRRAPSSPAPARLPMPRPRNVGAYSTTRRPARPGYAARMPARACGHRRARRRTKSVRGEPSGEDSSSGRPERARRTARATHSPPRSRPQS